MCRRIVWSYQVIRACNTLRAACRTSLDYIPVSPHDTGMGDMLREQLYEMCHFTFCILRAIICKNMKRCCARLCVVWAFASCERSECLYMEAFLLVCVCACVLTYLWCSFLFFVSFVSSCLISSPFSSLLRWRGMPSNHRGRALLMRFNFITIMNDIK